ncbi:MAG TPA: hypothetical protein VME45_22110 [Stellaceae bacterium]|nr:hypothetical protein [Stellaceae bacterium]
MRDGGAATAGNIDTGIATVATTGNMDGGTGTASGAAPSAGSSTHEGTSPVRAPA